MLLQSIVIVNFLHLTIGANMKTEILILNKSICDLKKEIDILESDYPTYLNEAKSTDLKIAYLKLTIAKNQDRILTLLS